MRRCSLLVVAVLTASACSPRTQGRIAGALTTVGGGALIGVGLTTDTTRSSFDDAFSAGVDADLVTGLGLLMVAGGITWLVANELETPPPPPGS